MILTVLHQHSNSSDALEPLWLVTQWYNLYSSLNVHCWNPGNMTNSNDWPKKLSNYIVHSEHTEETINAWVRSLLTSHSTEVSFTFSVLRLICSGLMKARACPKPAASLRNYTECPVAGGQINVSSVADCPRLNMLNPLLQHSFGYSSSN